MKKDEQDPLDAQQQGDTKAPLPGVITPKLVELKINTAVVKHKLSLADLEKRALEIIKNEDHLKTMADLLKDLDKVEEVVEEVFKSEKKYYLDGGRACDAGKKLVLTQTTRIRGMFRNDYYRLLAAVAQRKRTADLKKAQDDAILKGIESNVINFSNRIVAAVTRKALTDVESLINLEKSSSRAKKYGEFHAKAIERYDAVLIPVIRDQKKKIEQLEKLNSQLLEAEAHNDPEKMEALDEQINNISNEILQNHAVVQDAALNQESFPIIEATEVLPEFKVKRTNYTMEIDDVEIALKKARDLLEFGINKEAAKEVLAKLREEGAFDDKDEVIVNGIKYIATKVREAL